MTNEEFIQSIALEGEEWRDVVGYEGYYIVSNLGRIATIRDFYEYTRNGKTFIKNWPRHICSTSIAPTTHYERMTFKAINEKGVEVQYEVLFTFESDETKKKYIVYTDDTTDDSGNVKVYASTYVENGEKYNLSPIETEKEWKVIETILNELQANLKPKNGTEE